MFHVFSDSHSVIVTMNPDDFPNHSYNYQGEFEVFTHAKELAMQIMTTKVSNYRQDYEEAKLNKILLSNTSKKKLLEESNNS